MARYFIEVAYKGTRYSGFQVQDNAVTIQSEIENAFQTLHRMPVRLTGSSRTDSGVHALQNFFHFDFDRAVHPQAVYKLNAILSKDIVVRNLYLLHAEAHSRFDATSREYLYRIHRFKNPFLQDTSLYYPYDINIDLLQKGASYIAGQHNFFAFSKTNTQVKNFNCHIYQSYWTVDGDSLAYHIVGNRFLRGMVRIITATLLKYARGKISDHQFESLFSQEKKGGHSAPAHGLYLKKVEYPENYFSTSVKNFSAF